MWSYYGSSSWLSFVDIFELLERQLIFNLIEILGLCALRLPLNLRRQNALQNAPIFLIKVFAIVCKLLEPFLKVRHLPSFCINILLTILIDHRFWCLFCPVTLFTKARRLLRHRCQLQVVLFWLDGIFSLILEEEALVFAQQNAVHMRHLPYHGQQIYYI